MQVADVRCRIESHFESLSPELKRAARWLAANPADIGRYSMRAVARRANVQPATLSRLSHALGFERYEDLREPFRASLVLMQAADYAGRAEVLQAHRDPIGQRAEAINSMQRANVASVLDGPWANDFEAAARSLLEARRVGVLGLRASHGVAHHFQYLLDMLRDETLLLTDTAGTLLDQVHRLGPEDRLVVFSQAPYTRVARETARKAASGGIGLVAITDSPLSPIARPARHVLLARTDTPSYFQSVSGAIALGETLLQAIASLGGEGVLARLRTIQGHREADRAYIDPATATSRYLRGAQ
ncbi:MAG: MurR/RpiR family transcriptional regulator [Burkholderiaceae bacterium]